MHLYVKTNVKLVIALLKKNSHPCIRQIEYFSEPKASQIVPKMSQNLRPPTPKTIIKSYD